MNFHSYILEKNPDLTEAQLDKIKNSEEYIKKHNLNKLFNELLAHILWEQPGNVKAALKKQLESIKSNPRQEKFFTRTDFENLFNSLDIQKQGRLQFQFLAQALNAVGIEYSPELYKETYGKDIQMNSQVSKSHFLEIIEKEYEKATALKN